MVWSQIDVTKAHVAYAVVAVFSTCFSLCSLFVKEKLYLGEASVATVYGLIVGPHCLDWFNPLSWGNYFYITLEISRVLLCIEIVAVSVELPKKYVLKHWFPLFLLLIPCMTAGWLIIGAFIYAIIPGLTFSYGLLISACITATDPILAQAVVGKGKFAKRVPAHLRNLLSAESACNDGVSVPFVYLALNLILHKGHTSEIAKDWICVTVLYECAFGCLLGATIGYTGRKALRFAEDHDLIDHESFLAFYIMLALLCAGFGSILGIDDLLASFCAGTAFAWDGWFTHRTEESNISTVIDILLNMAYFVYFGSIIPWEDFNNTELGLNCWRLICLAIVVLCLRRLPAVLLTKFINPDIKNWKEAIFVGHFGPIGVGAVFAAIIAISDLEADILHLQHGPTINYPVDSEYYQLVRIIWPTVCFLIVTSIIVHGSSVAVLTLGKQLQSMSFTMTWTKPENETYSNGNWFNRLPKIERSGTSFSLKRIDTMANQYYRDYSMAPTESNEEMTDEKVNARINANIGMERFGTLSNVPTMETHNAPVRPIGGANRKKKRKLLKRKQSLKRKQPPVSETLDLRNLSRNAPARGEEESNEPSNDFISHEKQESEVGDKLEDTNKLTVPLQKIITNASESSNDSREESMTSQMHGNVHASPAALRKIKSNFDLSDSDLQPVYDKDGELRIPTQGYSYNDQLVIEDQHGEVLRTINSRTSTVHSTPSENSLRSRANTVTKRITSTFGSFLPQHDDIDSMVSGKSDKDHVDVRVTKPPNSGNSDTNVLDASNVEGSTVKDTNKKASEPTSGFKHTFDKFVDISDNLLFKNVAPRKTRKMHGFRVNNEIIIENEDGEILGRYKVNVKKQKAEEASEGINDKQYNDNLIGKAMKYIGLKKEKEIIDEEMNQLSNTDLVPEDETVGPAIEDKIKHFINADPKKAVVKCVEKSQGSLRSRVNTLHNKNKQTGREKYPSVLIHDSDSEYSTDEGSEGEQDDDNDDHDDDDYHDDEYSFNSSDEDNYTLDSTGHLKMRKDQDKNKVQDKKETEDTADCRNDENKKKRKKKRTMNLLYGESKHEKARRVAALDKSKRDSADEEE